MVEGFVHLFKNEISQTKLVVQLGIFGVQLFGLQQSGQGEGRLTLYKLVLGELNVKRGVFFIGIVEVLAADETKKKKNQGRYAHILL
jgi:hypothetical protein